MELVIEENDYIRSGLAEKLLSQARNIQEKTITDIEDKTFIIYPNVFNPIVYPAILFFTRSFLKLVQQLTPRHALEIGAGAGYNAVLAAFNGAAYVTCTDVSATAVSNIQENIEKHQLGNRVTVIHSDVFDSLPSTCKNKFDMIFWNVPFGHINKPISELTDLERCVFDPGYEAIGKYLRDIKQFLAPNVGRGFIGFSTTVGHFDHLVDIAAKYHWKLQLVNEYETIVSDTIGFKELGSGFQLGIYEIIELTVDANDVSVVASNY